MKIKIILKALCIKAKQFQPFRRNLAKSYVSLFFVMVLALTSTMAWFTARESAKLLSENLEFQSASSLRINKDKYSANKITIPAFTLDEASSLDGRNLYFPIGASFTENTAEMFFREGNKGDENVHYVYKDFDLKGTSGNTPVYIKSYKIQVGDDIYQDELKVEDEDGKPNKQILPPDNCPVRLAFISDSGVKPVVIDPSAQVVDYVDNSPGAVSLVDDKGVPTLEATYPNYNWNSFSTYYYEHTPLFIIPGGQTLKVTLVVWLEGTLENCDKYKGKSISVDIDIESNFAEMDTITFVDGTIGDTDSNVHNWIDNLDNDKEPIIACSYKDPYSEEGRWKTVIMRKTKTRTGTSSSDQGSEWQAEIPRKAVTNISFYRLNPHNGENQAKIYNAWHTRKDVMTMVNPLIPDIWYNNNDNVGILNSPLQETRQFFDSSTNTYDNSLVYTAVHGNNYSTTSAENQRLSPCIGYWNYTAGSGSSSTGGGGQQSGGGGSSTVTNCDVTVIARLPDGKSWVSGTDTLGFETESGNSYYFTGSWSGDGKSNQLTVSLPVGEKIVRFCKMNSSGTNYYPFNGGTQTWTVPNSTSYTITYELTDRDYWGHN